MSNIFGAEGYESSGPNSPKGYLIQKRYTATADQKIFVLPSLFMLGHLQVYLNGNFQDEGLDYSINPDNKSFTFTRPLRAKDVVRVILIQSASDLLDGNIGTAQGVTLTPGVDGSFSLPWVSRSKNEMVVFRDGIAVSPEEYNLAGVGDKLTLVQKPTSAVKLYVVRNRLVSLLGIDPNFNFTQAERTELVAVRTDLTALRGEFDIDKLNPVIASLNGGQLGGFRNRIINGSMEVLQRAASSAVNNLTPTFGPDRWFANRSGSGALNITTENLASLVNKHAQALTLVATADHTVAASDYLYISQKIEGLNCRALADTGCMLSFNVKAPRAGTFCISLTNSTSDKSYIVEYTVDAANVWKKVSVSIPGGIPSANGTWRWDTGTGLEVRFMVNVGTSLYGAKDSWLNGNVLSTSNHTNALRFKNETFSITGVQLEEGTKATPFEFRPYGVELALAMRYYEFDQSVAKCFSGQVTSGSTYSVATQFIVPKRATPTIATFLRGSTSFALGSLVIAESNFIGFRATTPAANATAVGFYGYSYSANAEL